MRATPTKFVCASCGYESVRWLGRCPGCDAYDTLAEHVVLQEARQQRTQVIGQPRSLSLSAVRSTNVERLSTYLPELDRVLGGGVVPGSTVLIGGEPGVGKSTLLLQASAAMGSEERAVLYVTGEESLEQVGLRAERLGLNSDHVLALAETDVESVVSELSATQPAAVVIDSIQTMTHPSLDSSVGSVSQIRECTATLLRSAKHEGVPVFMIGHVTKEGVIAGPRVLEHMVDTVLYLEGDSHYALRVLRATKNRFGATGEVGVFRLTETGLEEVENPSEYLLSQTGESVSGSCVAVVAEGKRPFLVEVQALVAPTYFGAPRRVVTGADYNRVAVVIAVLERRANCRLGDKDVYVSVAGGMRVGEPAADLPIALAIASSACALYNANYVGIPRMLAAFGEIGLSGEVRAVSLPDRRIAETARLGFDRCVGPRSDVGHQKNGDLEQLVEVLHLKNALHEAGIVLPSHQSRPKTNDE